MKMPASSSRLGPTMSRSRFQALLSSGIIWIPGIAWVTHQAASGYRPNDLILFVMATLVVVIGELLEVDLRGGLSTAVSSSVVFALFVVLPPVEVSAITTLAYAIGLLFRTKEGEGAARFRSTSRRLGAMLLSLLVYGWLSTVIPVE